MKQVKAAKNAEPKPAFFRVPVLQALHFLGSPGALIGRDAVIDYVLDSLGWEADKYGVRPGGEGRLKVPYWIGRAFLSLKDQGLAYQAPKSRGMWSLTERGSLIAPKIMEAEPRSGGFGLALSFPDNLSHVEVEDYVLSRVAEGTPCFSHWERVPECGDCLLAGPCVEALIGVFRRNASAKKPKRDPAPTPKTKDHPGTRWVRYSPGIRCVACGEVLPPIEDVPMGTQLLCYRKQPSGYIHPECL